ncbi:hypothetical protein [Kitasatospora sp. NPDC093102]|uniref:hypothetical protein n=1 Tax=Kitasatospora sp. NPDC093102 TaxID=3155069 RepID=UPI003430F7D7
MTKSVGLKELCERLPAMAEDYGLRLVPAVPENHKGSAAVDDTVMTPEQLCDLARAAGARILFHRTIPFDSAALLEDLEDAEDDQDTEQLPHARSTSPAVDSLRRRMRQRDGQAPVVELCVVLDGVAVLWSRTAPWVDDLLAALSEVQEEQAAQAQHTRTLRAQGAQEEIARITQLLCDAPSFRAATTAAARRRAADSLLPTPDPADREARNAHWRGIDQALADVEAASSAIYNDFKTKLNDLADELVASGALDDARTLQVRKIRLKDFLQHRSGGYAPPTDVLALMLELPQLRHPVGTRRAVPGRQRKETLFAVELPE